MKDIFIVRVEGLVVVEIGATEIPGIIKSEASLAIAIPFNATGLFPALFLGAWCFCSGVFEAGLWVLGTD